MERLCRLCSPQLVHCPGLRMLRSSLQAEVDCAATDMLFGCTLIIAVLPCRRDGQQHNQMFHRGVAAAPLASQKLPKGNAKRKGTEVRFLFDKQVFAKG